MVRKCIRFRSFHRFSDRHVGGRITSTNKVGVLTSYPGMFCPPDRCLENNPPYSYDYSVVAPLNTTFEQ